MKKLYSIILCLAFFSLACLSTSAASSIEQESPAGTAATLTNTPAPGASTSTPTLTIEPDELRCAVVVAVESLHLREGPSEDAKVLTWLKSGDELHLLSKSDLNWWSVSFEDFEGFARSIYLEESECE